MMPAAHALARRALREQTCKFSRYDFTLPQLLACLVIREHQNYWVIEPWFPPLMAILPRRSCGRAQGH